MSRAERLLHLTQVMRRHRRSVRGKALADELGVSIRTLYRDIASLQAQGATRLTSLQPGMSRSASCRSAAGRPPRLGGCCPARAGAWASNAVPTSCRAVLGQLLPDYGYCDDRSFGPWPNIPASEAECSS